MAKNRQDKDGAALEGSPPGSVSNETGDLNDDPEIPPGQGSPAAHGTSSGGGDGMSNDPVAYFIDKNTLLSRQVSQDEGFSRDSGASREQVTPGCDSSASHSSTAPTRTVPSYEDYCRAINNSNSAFAASRTSLAVGGFQQPPLFSTGMLPGQGHPFSGAGAPVFNTGTWTQTGQCNSYQ